MATFSKACLPSKPTTRSYIIVKEIVLLTMHQSFHFGSIQTIIMFSIHFTFFVEMNALDSFAEIFELLFSWINEFLVVFQIIRLFIFPRSNLFLCKHLHPRCAGLDFGFGSHGLMHN